MVLVAMITYLIYKCCGCIVTGQDHHVFNSLDTHVAVDNIPQGLIIKKKWQGSDESMLIQTIEDFEVCLNCLSHTL